MTTPIASAALTDVGRERTENQDAFGQLFTETADFWFVCDGLGGHKGGSTASRLAVELITSSLQASSSDELATLHERIQIAITRANQAIAEMSQQRRELRGMGTTCVLLVIHKELGTALVAHVGDSRGYLLRAGVLRQLTRDHTMVQRLVDDGIISPEAAATHPNSNVISRSLGGRDDVDVEFIEQPIELQQGDTFILCSDGLYGPCPEADFARVAADESVEDAARICIEKANAGGGPDNITVSIVRWGDRAVHPDVIEVQKPPRLVRPPRVVPDFSLEDTPAEGINRDALSEQQPQAAPVTSAPEVSLSKSPLALPPEPASTSAREEMLLSVLLATACLLALLVYFVSGIEEPGLHVVTTPPAVDSDAAQTPDPSP
jgi:serine/threonine protein phosphatase PrpC